MASTLHSRLQVSETASGFTARLIEAASRTIDDPALIQNRRGRWVRRRWRDVLAEVDRLSAGLASLGVGPATGVAIQGELSANALLVSAAVRAAGGRVVPVSATQSVDDIRTFLAAEPIALAIVQTREALEAWLDATETGAGIPIVFDHATPERQSPDERVIVLDALRRLAPARGWVEQVKVGGRPVRARTVWVEETLSVNGGFDAVLDAWIQGGLVLTLPERLDSAARDRAAISPERWIASAPALDAAAAAIQSRLPETGPTARLIARVVAGRRSPLDGLLRSVLRSRLGLGGLFEIELLAGTPSPATQATFVGLGVGIVDFVPRTPAGPEIDRPFPDFALHPGYSL